MFATITHIRVKAGHEAGFIAAVRANRRLSIGEPGCIRFDILQSAEDPSSFVTYMAWREESGLDEHRRTRHYVAFRDLVADWMAEPRHNTAYVGLFEPE